MISSTGALSDELALAISIKTFLLHNLGNIFASVLNPL